MTLWPRFQVISDNNVGDMFLVHSRLYADIDNTIAICRVHIHKNLVAEIYTIDVLKENNKRKHYGSTLWAFTEKYVIDKYHPKRFVGDLDVEHIPAVEFWKSQKFGIKKTKYYWMILKDL
jgi:hypothetical protein